MQNHIIRSGQISDLNQSFLSIKTPSDALVADYIAAAMRVMKGAKSEEGKMHNFFWQVQAMYDGYFDVELMAVYRKSGSQALVDRIKAIQTRSYERLESFGVGSLYNSK